MAALPPAAAMTQFLLNDEQFYFILWSYPEGTAARRLKRRPNSETRSQRKPKHNWMSSVVRSLWIIGDLATFPLPSLVWSVWKSVQFEMRQNKSSQVRVLALSLSLSLALRLLACFLWSEPNIASNQTKDKQFIKNGGTPSFRESHRSTCTARRKK